MTTVQFENMIVPNWTCFVVSRVVSSLIVLVDALEDYNKNLQFCVKLKIIFSFKSSMHSIIVYQQIKKNTQTC